MINSKGFTLIELVLVIAILAILAGILIPEVSGYVDRANEVADQANAKTCYTSAIASWTSNKAGLDAATTINKNCYIINSYITITNRRTRTTTSTPVGYDGDEYDPAEYAHAPIAASYGDWVYDSDGEFTLMSVQEPTITTGDNRVR